MDAWHGVIGFEDVLTVDGRYLARMSVWLDRLPVLLRVQGGSALPEVIGQVDEVERLTIGQLNERRELSGLPVLDEDGDLEGCLALWATGSLNNEHSGLDAVEWPVSVGMEFGMVEVDLDNDSPRPYRFADDTIVFNEATLIGVMAYSDAAGAFPEARIWQR